MFVTDPITGRASPVPLLLALASLGAAVLWTPDAVCAQEVPVEGCTFDATVTGFFEGSFEGRAWIGSPKAEGGALDRSDARRLHLCLGSSTSQIGCADPDGSKLFELTLPLPEPGQTGGYPTEALLQAWDQDVFRSTLVDRWSTVNGPGTLDLGFHEAGRQVLEHEVAALGRTYADTVYIPAARGTFQATLVPSWREIRPNTKMAWVEGGQTFEADPEITVNVAFNAGMLTVDPSATIGSDPSLVCTAARPFQVLARTPDEGHRNVDYRDGEVEVTFTAAADPASVTAGTFRVGYLDPEGSFVAAAGELEIGAGGRTIRFVPHRPLKDAVHYRVRVKGGPAGIRGADDEHLSSDAEWRFATAPDLSGELGVWGNVDLHVYQTARDVPLVPGKPSVLRVHAEWREDEEVHPDEQVVRVPAEVSIRDGTGGSIVEDEPFLFVRPDRYDDAPVSTEDAAHTLNHFGWVPARGAGSPLAAVVALESEATGDRLEFEAERAVDYWDHSPDFDFDYYFLRIGPWAETGGLSREDRASGHLIARRSEAFTTQTFPVRRTRARYRGDFLFQGGSGEDPSPEDRATYLNLDQASLPPSPGVSEYVEMFNNQVAPNITANALVALLPIASIGTGGSHIDWMLEKADAVDATAAPWVFRTVHVPVRGDIYLTSGLTHEFGHAFGLEHEPYVPDAASRARECKEVYDSNHSRYPGIEGFRIAPGGRRGWNKSYEEGNGEGEGLYPLMHPCAQPKRYAFPLNEQYEELQSGIGIAIESGTYGASGWSELLRLARPDLGVGPRDALGRSRSLRGPAAPDVRVREGRPAPGVPRSDAPADRNGVLVSGLVGPGGAPIAIGPIRSLPAERVTGRGEDPGGSFVAELVDEAGEAIRSVRFEPVPIPDDAGWRPFRVEIRDAPPFAGVVVRSRDGGESASRIRTPSAPTVRVRSPDPGVDWSSPRSLEWAADDADGDRLLHTVSYSPDGDRPWSVLAGPLGTDRLEIAPRDLEPGPTPTFRIVTTDGVNEGEARLRVRIRGVLRTLTHFPLAGDTVAPSVVVEATLNAEAARSGAPERFDLLDSRGRPVEVIRETAGGGRTLLMTPQGELEPGERYEAVLRAGLQDVHGRELTRTRRWSFTVDPDAEASESESTDAGAPEGGRGDQRRREVGDRKPPPDESAAGGPWDVLARTGSGEDAGAAVAITGPLQLVFGPAGSGTVALQGTCVPGGPTILKARLGEGDGNWLMMNTPASLGTAGPGDYHVPTLQLGLADGPGAGIYQGSGQLRIQGSGSARMARLTATLPPASGGAPVELALAFSPAAACRSG